MFTNGLLIVAQSTSQCTVNGEAVDCGDVGRGIARFFGFLGILALINFIFFLIAIIHLIKNSDVENRTLWIVASILIPFACWIYVLGPLRSYSKKKKEGVQATSQLHTPPNTASLASPVATGASVGNFQPSQPQTPPQQPPVTPPTSSEAPAPQVAAAPENPVQLPQPPKPQPAQEVAPSLSSEPQEDIAQTPATPPQPPSFPSETAAPSDQNSDQSPPSAQV